MEARQVIDNRNDKMHFNLAIVGGGKAAKFFLRLAETDSLPFISIKIVGVCDIDADAEGLALAGEMGIFTTNDFRDLFRIDNLDGLIELTNDRDVLLEIIRVRPKGLWVLDHNVLRVFQGMYHLDRELKSREQQFRVEKMVSEFLMAQAHERIIVLAPDFTIIDANESYLKAVNRSREETIEKHCYEITHGLSSPCSEWEPELGCPLVETLRTGNSAHVIHEHLGEQEQVSYCDLETYPVKNDTGDVVRVIEIWRDITEELGSRWEYRLNQLKTNLGKLVQEDRIVSLGKLSASCVHEINNPIQGLLTFSRLMESILSEGSPSQEDLDQLKEYLGIMSAELERCGNIISGLLSFARESTMETRDVQLDEILRAVIALTRHKMELQEIGLHLNMSAEPLHIQGDASQLQQCFLNLIFNAIEAMPEGGRLDISALLDRQKRRVCVTIQDTGCGIAEEEVDKIFDPFFSTKPEGKGTGLGLSIVYGIVKSHRGVIEVNSVSGQGSAFTLCFPVLED
jgi:signal transduction histidine kinase